MRALDIEDAAESKPAVHWSAERLFLAHAGFIASFLRRLGAHDSDVDDLVQDVFLLAHQKGGFQEGSAQPRTWLAAISVRLLQNRRRRLQRRREEGHDEVLDRSPATTKSPEESLAITQSLGRVQAALDTLDVDHRAAFLLYELESESCQTIAELLDVPVGTIYSRLHKARKMFLKAYQGSGDDPAVALSALSLALGIV